MRICVLQSAFSSAIDNYRCDPSPWLAEHVCEHHFVHKVTAGREVVALVRRGEFDLFVNLCDGSGDNDEAGIEVVATLERLGVAFTGADSGFYEPTRETMKLAAHACGIHTPHYLFVTDVAAADVAAERLRFPLLVKHANSYSSVGMTRGSRVETAEALRAEVARFVDRFGGALIEEFIEGREFTVLVAENPDDPRAPVAFTPLEVLFPEGETFKHHDLKFVDYASMHGRAVEDPALAGRLEALACALFVALDGCSYGRVDVRMGPDGELYMLEINPNCGLFYPPGDPGSADIILGHDPRGHRGFLELIFAAALRRGRRRTRRWCVVSVPGDGVGLHATEDLGEGEVILPGEGQSFRLATRGRLERRGEPVFALAGGLVALGCEQPGPWRMARHGCDPNAWFRGLDLVARRAIVRGEPITVDHGILYGDALVPFVCSCGAALCRGTIEAGAVRWAG